jgi:hypothetical protein
VIKNYLVRRGESSFTHVFLNQYGEPIGERGVRKIGAALGVTQGDEGIWHSLTHVELRNVVCADIEELRYELCLATARLRQKPDVIPGCMTQAGLRL